MFARSRFFLSAIALFAVIGLSGCKMFIKEDPPSCPRVSVLADGAHLVRFRDGAAGDKQSDVALMVKVAGYRGDCRFDKDSKTFDLAMNVGFDVARGPAATDSRGAFTYFIAIPHFQGNPDAKKELPISVDLPANGEFKRVEDQEVHVSFPVANAKDLQGYEVFIGVQLTKAELEYNQKHSFH